MKQWMKTQIDGVRKLDKKILRKYNIAFIIFNIILIASIGIIFLAYVRESSRELYEVTLREIEVDSSNISELVYSYLQQQQETVDSVVAYVEKAELTEEEIRLYLETIKNKWGNMALIDTDNRKGYQVKKTETGKSVAEPVDYSDNPAFKKICDTVKAGEENTEINIADILASKTLEKTSNIAIYKGVEVEGRQKVFLYIMSISDITEELLENQPLEYKQGLLINEDGRVLSSAKMLPEELKLGENGELENYYDYLEKEYGVEESKIIRNILRKNDSGVFVLEDSKDDKWVYAYSHVTETSGWTYLYLQQHKEQGMTEHSRNVLIEVVILLILICGIDIGIIFLQNRRLRKSLVDLVAANEAKNSFISNMSHEIRTPINAILGMDEMILRESTENEILQYAMDIKNAGKTLLGIINDILDFSKIGSGKMKLIQTEYEIASMVNDLLNMVESRARAKNLEIKVNIDRTMPHLLYGDELRIKQVILNILTNAVKYTEKGSVTFTMGYEKLDEEKISLYVSVKDTGIGLKPEDKERLCRPFERLDEKKNRTIEGTGLGMSIVTSLLKQMDSTLEVESTYGEGSEFSFHLVQKVADWEEMGNLDRIYLEAKNSEKEKGMLHASKARILVVDDTQVNLTVAAGLLKRTEVQVECALSGKECLAMLKEKRYHAVLLDHRMPEMDGVETLHHIREMDSPNKETPVIALTANAVSGAYEYYIKEGFNDFLSKPISGNRLERMLLKYLPEEVLDSEEEEKELPELSREAGIRACSMEEVYYSVIKEFSETAPEKAAEIRAYYEAGDLKNYTIKVHALKSSARLAGALALSEKARYLEQCGDEGKIEEIEAKTEELLTNYLDIGIKLKGELCEETDAAKKEIEPEQLKEAFLAILEFNEAFDFDNVDTVMDSLAEYRLPAEAGTAYDKLKKAVLDVEQEKIKTIIQDYLGGAESE